MMMAMNTITALRILQHCSTKPFVCLSLRSLEVGEKWSVWRQENLSSVWRQAARQIRTRARDRLETSTLNTLLQQQQQNNSNNPNAPTTLSHRCSHFGYANPNPLRTMILNPSKVVLLLLQLILVCALATTIAAEVQGECSADGSCEATDANADVDAAVLTAPGGDEQRRRITPACEDKESQCSFWASEGECENNPSYMLSE